MSLLSCQRKTALPAEGTSASSTDHSVTSANGKEPIVPEISVSRYAAMMNNERKEVITKIDSLCISVAEVDPDWAFTHHAMITVFQDVFYAMWSSGRIHEDDCGQRILYATSRDGVNWGEPIPLIDSLQGQYSEEVLTAGGFYVNGDTLVAYAFVYEYQKQALSAENCRPMEGSTAFSNFRTLYMTTTDGTNWSEPDKLPLSDFAINTPPITLQSGRLLMCAMNTFAYTDYADGINGWKKVGISQADLEKVQAVSGILCEAACFQTPEGIINMLFRNLGDSFVYCAQSYDDGETFTKPYRTNITNDNSKFCVGILPDGQYYYIGNTYPESGRNPLVICLSTDGCDFSRQFVLRDEVYQRQYDGFAKGGTYGYPQAIVEGEYLYVIYTKQKECVEITRIALSDLTVKN